MSASAAIRVQGRDERRLADDALAWRSIAAHLFDGRVFRHAAKPLAISAMILVDARSASSWNP
jgi:hypothetical protein